MNSYRLVTALGVLLVSSAAILIRLADAPPLVVAAYRLCLASLIVAPVALVRSRDEIRRLGLSKILLAVLSGFFLAVHFALWIASLDYTSVASSVVLVTSSPVFVALLSFWLFRERLTSLTLVGMGVCFVGAGVIGYVNWETGPAPLLGAWLAFLGAIAISGSLLIGRKLRQNMGLLSYIFLTYSAAGVTLLAAVWILGLPLTGYTDTTYLMFILLALIPQILGHSALNWALRYISATEITIAVLGEPVIATILAYFFLSEVAKPAEIAGGLVILGGIYLALRKAPVQGAAKA